MGRGEGKRNPKKRLTELRERDDYKKELSDIMSERSKSPMNERKSTHKDKKISKTSISSRMSMGNSSMMLGDNDLELGKSIASTSFKSSVSPLDRSRNNTVDNKKRALRIALKRKAWYRRHDSCLCKAK